MQGLPEWAAPEWTTGSGATVAVLDAPAPAGRRKLPEPRRHIPARREHARACGGLVVGQLGGTPRPHHVGGHVGEANLTFLRGREISFHADRPFTAYADGDPIAELPATVRVVPGCLRVLTP